LICFPSAGKGAAHYMSWRRLLPSAIDVLPARLPGREGRSDEAPITEIPLLVELLAVEIERLPDVPFALFGHSLGALVAFELTRLLRKRERVTPVLLMVAAQAAPHLESLSPIYHLPSNQFLEVIQDRYGAVDDEILRDQELMARFEPILRADLTLFDSYRYSEDAPLECPIAAFGGARDRSTSESALNGWNQHTSKEFSCRFFEGGHFFFGNDRAVLRSLLNEVTHLLAYS
jgi:surfactin synthase thioesterase subunit